MKNTHAEKYKEESPEAVEAIIHNHYVDDYLDSFDDMGKAVKTVTDVIQIHDEANFKIRNFISNSKTLLKQLPEDRISPVKEVSLDDSESVFEKVLGMYWNTRDDKFFFKITPSNKNLMEPTKRQVLSFIMSVYDPLGLIAHITIESKILMQDIWRLY